jgi:superfamily II DNA helicase RecQ
MQMRIFAIPMDGDDEAMEECNHFLRANKVLSVEKVPVVERGRNYWSVCVEYLPRRNGEPMPGRSASATAMERPRIDYRELLTGPQFERYSKLRSLRKQIADQEAVPVYTILTNAQLADLARKVPKSKAGFLSIEGIGEAKATRYAGAFLTVLCTMPEPEVEAVQQAQAEGSATDSEVVISAAVPAMTAD